MAILPELLVASPTLQDFLIGKDALPLAAGVVTCYHDNSRTILKNWYYQTGTPGHYTWIPLPNPLTLSAAGTISDANGNDVIPFFYPWFTDDKNQTTFDPYFITVYDRNGEFQFSRAFFPFEGTQVGPPSPEDIYTLENYVINNRFWRNIGSLVAGTLVPNPTSGVGFIQTGNFGLSYNNTLSANYYYATLAPSQNDGFSMPDFNYIKNAQGGSESISFLKFLPSSSSPIGGDVAPEYYIEHICGEQDPEISLKIYQFPISLHLATLAEAKASVSIQARSNSGGTLLTLALYQFQGTGNVSTQSIPFASFPLTTSWQKYSANVVFPDDTTVTPSLTGDDAWYLQIGMPVNSPFQLDFTLPSLYLNPLENIPTNAFDSYDQIDSIVSKPRTGDVRISINNLYPYGWLPMNGGTIGNGDSNATARPNIDSWPLYNLLWNTFHSLSTNGNPLVPIYDSVGVPTTYGASSLEAWTLNKAIALTQSMGQVLLGTVPLTALLPAKPTLIGYSSIVTASNSSGVLWTTDAANLLNLFQGNTITFSGTSALVNVTANVVYYVVPASSTTFHIATSFANALAGTFVAFTGAEIGIVTASLQPLGSYEGEYAHTQLLSEIAAHVHNPLAPGNAFAYFGGAPSLQGGGTAVATVPTTGAINRANADATSANVTQPGTFNNIYIKL